MSREIKEREREHFDNLDVNPLAFLEKDGTAASKAAIRFLLSRWDGHLRYIPVDALRGKTVLDACCGNPRIISWMRSRGATSFGCDISIKMLTMGSGTGESYVLDEKVKLSPVSWTIADCEQMPFESGTFDTVTCFQAFHHINPEFFLGECRRLLKPGGVLIISDPNGDHFLRAFGTWLGRKMGLLSVDEKALGRNEITGFLNSAGFRVQWCRSINFFSETIFLFEEVRRRKNPLLSWLLRASLLLFYPVDWILDNTLFRIIPALAWRNIFYAVKEQ